MEPIDPGVAEVRVWSADGKAGEAIQSLRRSHGNISTLGAEPLFACRDFSYFYDGTPFDSREGLVVSEGIR